MKGERYVGVNSVWSAVDKPLWTTSVEVSIDWLKMIYNTMIVNRSEMGGTKVWSISVMWEG